MLFFVTIFFCRFRLPLASTICPWVSEDGMLHLPQPFVTLSAFVLESFHCITHGQTKRELISQSKWSMVFRKDKENKSPKSLNNILSPEKPVFRDMWKNGSMRKCVQCSKVGRRTPFENTLRVQSVQSCTLLNALPQFVSCKFLVESNWLRAVGSAFKKYDQSQCV